MANQRLFIAVELPAAVQRQLAAVERDLAESGADVKWSRSEDVHLTLKFLGDMPEEEVPKLAAALDEVASQVAPHVVRLTGVGAFPDRRRPRVVWVGLDEPSGQLVALQQRVDEITKHLLEMDPRDFTPHLTLGRVRTSKNLARLSAMLEDYRLKPKANVPIKEIMLIRSELTPRGPIYTLLHRAALAGAPA